jgi:hypothetical protein
VVALFGNTEKTDQDLQDVVEVVLSTDEDIIKKILVAVIFMTIAKTDHRTRISITISIY